MPRIGSTFHCVWSDLSNPARARITTLMADAGMRSVRMDVGWSALQPTPRRRFDRWQLRLTDRCVDLARARGMDVLLTVLWTPPWASSSGQLAGPPRDMSSFAWFAKTLARHFRGRVGAYEIWNEQDEARFWTGSVPDYVRLLRAGYGAIKAGDAHAKVVIGGTVHNNTQWIEAAYRAGARGSFDVMATHPYQGLGDAPPEVADTGASWWLLTHVRAVHALMSEHGDGAKPIWFTEFGWSDHDNVPPPAAYRRGVPADVQGAYLVRTIQLLRAQFPYVRRAYWYKAASSPRDDVHESGYGLLRANLAPRPAYYALKRFLRRQP